MVAQPSPAPSGEDRFRRLVEAGIRINAERTLDGVLQAVVDAAREVIGARYAALGVLDATGTGLSQFVTSGISRELRERMGPLPVGKGAIGDLYVTDKIGGPEFTDADESIAILLAASAAVALDNTSLYEESQ